MYASFAGPGGILSPVDTGYGSGDGKVTLSVDDPGHTCTETGINELQENGNCLMFEIQTDSYIFARGDETITGSMVLHNIWRPFSVAISVNTTAESS